MPCPVAELGPISDGCHKVIITGIIIFLAISLPKQTNTYNSVENTLSGILEKKIIVHLYTIAMMRRKLQYRHRLTSAECKLRLEVNRTTLPDYRRVTGRQPESDEHV